jgi:hypothetical protein
MFSLVLFFGPFEVLDEALGLRTENATAQGGIGIGSRCEKAKTPN